MGAFASNPIATARRGASISAMSIYAMTSGGCVQLTIRTVASGLAPALLLAATVAPFRSTAADDPGQAAPQPAPAPAAAAPGDAAPADAGVRFGEEIVVTATRTPRAARDV